MTERAQRLDPALQLLGVTIRQYRQERGLSQRALADRTGLLRSYIGQIERGLRNIAVLTLLRLAQALEIPPAWLLAPLDPRAAPAPSGDQTFSIRLDDPATLLHRLGGTIRRYRQQRHLVQVRLAAQTGLHPTYISGIEQGHRNVSVLSLVCIADALALSVSQLLAPLDTSQHPSPPLPEKEGDDR